MHKLRSGAQLEHPSRPAKARQQVERLTARLSVLPFDSDAAAHTAERRATLYRGSCIVGPYDLMIASHARSRGLIVVTGHLRAFRRVDGLGSEDWFSDIA